MGFLLEKRLFFVKNLSSDGRIWNSICVSLKLKVLVCRGLFIRRLTSRR